MDRGLKTGLLSFGTNFADAFSQARGLSEQRRARDEARALQERQMEQARADREAAIKLGLLQQGFTQDETGGLIRTPQFIQEQKQSAMREARKGLIDAQRAGYAGEIATDEQGMPYFKQSGLTPEKQQERELDSAYKRAQISSLLNNGKDQEKNVYKKLPEESQQIVKELTAKKTATKSVELTLGNIIEKLEDPKIDDGQKYNLAMQSMKALNEAASSSNTADAVGEGEVSRLAGYLSFTPKAQLRKGFGADIPGFTQNVRLLKDNLTKKQNDYDKIIQGEYVAAGLKYPRRTVGSETAGGTPQPGSANSFLGGLIKNAEASRPIIRTTKDGRKVRQVGPDQWEVVE